MARRRKKKAPKIIEKLSITGVADKGLSVGRTEEGEVIFVERVAPGDIVDVQIVRKKKAYSVAFPIKWHEYSTDRTEPFCEHYGVCGGCKWQHVTYESQIKQKEQVVRDAMRRLGKVRPREFFPIIPCEKTQYYRNKLEFTFSNKRWLAPEELNQPDVTNFADVLGFHRPGAFDKIVNINHCFLQPDPSNDLRNAIRDIAEAQGLAFFDLRANKGFMRHIMIRNTALGEWMLIVSFFENDPSKIQPFFDAVLEKFPQLTSIFYCINAKLNDFVGDLEMICHYGKGYIEEQLGHIRFRIGPKSFFQTNSDQAKVLYDKVVEFAGLTGEENVYDLYTGVGSIALYVAKNCRHVVGIEEVEEAIKAAKVNAEMNDIQNCSFYVGDVRKILTDEFAAAHGKPDLVITDPPRAGMHPNVVKMFMKLEAPKIVYVSCNPASQGRDLNMLAEKYWVEKVVPVDMFPHTHHIETVALLKLKEKYQ